VVDLDRGWPAGRLDLEPLTVAHAAELAPLRGDASVHAFTGGAPVSAAALAARFARLAARRSPDGDQMWGNGVLRIRAAGAVAGTVQATRPAGGRSSLRTRSGGPGGTSCTGQYRHPGKRPTPPLTDTTRHPPPPPRLRIPSAHEYL
jgi:hypothetical protein